MQNGEKIKDIHERIYQFVIRVINLVKQLPKTPENIILINQITKSVTSMGANDQEADGTDSKKDFIAKYSIVRKEGKETSYWLRLIFDTNPSFRLRMKGLMQEGKEIVKIVSTIILNSKRKQ
ncbi:MAG: four helix bundle protein [Patescibacteria group bacterium]